MSDSHSLDLDFVRQQFPAFAEPSLKDSAFFENAGGSYMCQQVMQRLDSYFHNTKVQPYHPYPQAQLAGQQMDDAYTALADWLNVSGDEVYFGPSTSQNTYVLANAMQGWLQAGDEIIVTNQDHEANSGVWRNLAARGMKITQWSVNPETGSLDIEQLQQLFNDKTKLLVFPHCSNILGEINAIADICQLAKKNQVRTVVDGVSFAGHGLPDVSALRADIYLFSLYKVYGTHQGIMVVRSDMNDLLVNQGHYFNSDLREKRLTPAGPDHAQIAAARGVCDYFSAIYQHHFSNADASALEKSKAVHDLFVKAEQQTLQPLLEFFQQHPSIRIIGPQGVENRAPTVAIIVENHSSMALAKALGEKGIMCGAGHFYSLRLLQAMQIDTDDGVLRFSLVHYTGKADVDKLISVLSALIA
ncbi:MAG: selenocysteine lyase/cysteine desulfurase [Oceanospirillaceae bacterium]|jgi:selenocysteine lyase/cysteine desulfurase